MNSDALYVDYCELVRQAQRSCAAWASVDIAWSDWVRALRHEIILAALIEQENHVVNLGPIVG